MTENLFSNLSPITSKPSTLTDFVFDALCENIIHGRLGPGERLREAEVARALGVSRTPIREAFARMEHQNLIQRDTSGAYYVTHWDRNTLWEVATLRGALEGLAIQLAASHAVTKDFEQFDQITNEMERFQDQGNHDNLIALDMQFHTLVWSLSQHTLLQQALNDIRAQVMLFMHLTRPGEERGYADTHRLLIRLMKSGDLQAASEKIREHILNTARRGILRMEEMDQEHLK
ncbi:MAG: GntR family transcriptional regulator [Anaerolineaceae bacterium]|nr:GntR family transcriptional regulator [Anaerolineaceae bacterium]